VTFGLKGNMIDPTADGDANNFEATYKCDSSLSTGLLCIPVGGYSHKDDGSGQLSSYKITFVGGKATKVVLKRVDA
jgi:hypothetical protein